MCHPLWICAGAGVQAPRTRVLAWCLVGTELVVSEALCWELKTSVVVLFLSQVSPKQYPSRKATLEVTLLEVLLDLVDRYWSGCKSLHSNEAFLGELGGTVSWSALRHCVNRCSSSCWVLGPAPGWTRPPPVSRQCGHCAVGSLSVSSQQLGLP